MSKWVYEFDTAKHHDNLYEIHRFIKDKKQMDHYDTEEYLNKLEELLKECYNAMNVYYGCFESEFRISTDKPDTEYEDLCKRVESVLGNGKNE
jgi:hypothetical protein